ncbi:MAG: beta-N-acetylhexosaminidase [Rikenellaceae bacterium]|jgi:hexosaminidase|nr:beta-N-acetylhexosaminidase [Rikenellaceae bacterium]
MNPTIKILLLAAGLAGAARTGAQAKADLIPLPVQVMRTSGEFLIGPRTEITIPKNRQYEAVMADYLNKLLGTWFADTLPVRQEQPGFQGALRTDYIALTVDSLLQSPDGVKKRMPDEGYILRVTPHGVDITGVDNGGLFNGVQTFLQLMPTDIYRCKKNNVRPKISGVEIVDWPAYPYRGMMLDVARTFMPASTVKLFIDRLAYHKINKLHWHLTDDEGWRIEIKSYPELALRGGYRGPNLPVKPIYGAWDRNYGGYYTQDEIREIIAYAAERNIEIIPEIDLPGHSRAVARIHPEILCPGNPDISAASYDRRNVWCATREANYKILAKVFEEICALFPSEYINIGGDEVGRLQWLGCPTCRKLAAGTSTQPIQDHFTTRLTAILAANGKKPAVWDEAGASGKLSKTARIHGWQHVESCQAATAKGYTTIIMPGSYFYFDMKQSPWEAGLTWAGLVDTRRTYSIDLRAQGFTEQQMSHVVGFEGAFFSELLLSNGGEDYLFYQVYPRICALSEVAWTQQRLRNTDDFHNRLYGRHADRLTAMGIKFRVPPPDAFFAEGKIDVGYQQRHTGVRYTTNGTPPDRKSEHFSCPIADPNIQRYRFRSYFNDSQSADVPVIIRHPGAIPAKGNITAEIPLPTSGGLWYLRIRSTETGATINSIKVIGTDSSASFIIRNPQKVNEQHQMRFYATQRNMGGTMQIAMRNDNRLPTVLSFQFERSQYIEPAVKVTSSMPQNPKFPFSKLVDYNFSTYARTSRTCRPGDHFTFTFDQGVECQSIEVQTGLSYMPRYHIPEGRVELSMDGAEFTISAQLEAGRAIIKPPKGTVKAVRIVSTADSNGEDAVAIQDLRIIPKYK